MKKQSAQFLLVLVCLIASTVNAGAKSNGKKVLIVLSSTHTLTLKDGAKHPTGFYMNELGVPLKSLVDAGYEQVFCNPEGNEPVMDAGSDNKALFASEEEYEAVKTLL